MKIYVPIILSLFFTLTITAQKTFFETIASHGEDATYQRYYSVYKDDNGKQVISGKQYVMTAKTLYAEHVKSGFQMSYVPKPGKDEGTPYNTANAGSDSAVELKGFPNTSQIYLAGMKKKAWIAIDDYIFKVSGFAEDGITFSYIDELFIRVGASGDSNSKDAKKKKKKLGGFLKKLKEAATTSSSSSECTSPACKKAASMDLFAYVQDYIRKMQKIQAAYTLTSQDRADLATIEAVRLNYRNGINKKNDAYWNSAEGRAIRKNQETVDAVHADHLRTCKLYSCDHIAHK